MPMAVCDQRPCVNRVRVHPSELRAYRMSHRMLGPCCLCPLFDATNPDYVEAPMYMKPKGPHAGHYVASCVEDRCGYFGKRNSI
jgi:hypothetical protein